METIVILLKTYVGDIEYVKRLIRTYKRYNADNIPLYIVVPESDMNHFKRFIGKEIKLLSDESVTKDLVHDNSIRGIRLGYINQEIIKLAFWEKRLCKNYFCMDADGVFIRKFYKSDFMYDKTTPYTILVEDNELKVDPEYYKFYWRERETLIRKIQKEVGLNDRRMLTYHGFVIVSSKVLESFHRKYLTPKRKSYKDILKISPYEFSWYNMWLQKDKTIPIEIREPLIKLFYKKSQHIEYLKKGITLKDIARGYIGYVINSNYSRGFGIVNYDEPKKYGIVIDRLKINIRKLANFLH
ncbi:MAG: DUF6492 family protein [Candidatus Microgenomates bacterium]